MKNVKIFQNQRELIHIFFIFRKEIFMNALKKNSETRNFLRLGLSTIGKKNSGAIYFYIMIINCHFAWTNTYL